MANYKVFITISNMKDIINFAEKIKQMPECKHLTSEEKLKIIYSYPFNIKVI